MIDKAWIVEHSYGKNEEDEIEWEMWEVTDGMKQFNTPHKSHAKWLANLLNGNHQERKV